MIDVFKNIRHKKIAIVGCFILLLLSIPSFFQWTKTKAPEVPITTPHVPDELIINIKDGLSAQYFMQTIPAEFGFISYKKVFPEEKTSPLANYYLFTLKKGADLDKVKAYLQKRQGVQSADYNHLMSFEAISNDPLAPYQWPLQKINLEDAWGKITDRDSKIMVAVVDSGVDYNHEDFNTDVIKKGGNFTPGGGGKNGDPMDTNGHGTIVAGIIGAAINNNKGIAGISKNPSLLAVKIGGDNGINEDDSIRGMQSAIADGAKIINMSFGHPEACSPLYQDFINSHKNIVFIAAAGNGGIDAKDRAPASCDGVIAVASTNRNDRRAESSNWGEKVALAAPGVEILSTKSRTCSFCRAQQGVPPGYYIDSGTSFAAPHVSGVAALLLAKYPQLSPIQVKECLTKGGDKVQFDKPIGPRLNAAKALNECQTIIANLPSPTTPSPSPTPSPITTAIVKIEDATPTRNDNTSGKLICSPVGGMDNKLNANAIQITNGTNVDVPIWYQSNLCEYAPNIALVEGYQCNTFKGRANYTLSKGQTKIITLDIPLCSIGQLDINTVNPQDKGCYRPDDTNKLWDGGLAFAIQANTNGCNTATPTVTTTTIPTSGVRTLDSAGFLRDSSTSLPTPTPRTCAQPQVKCTNNGGSVQICSFTCN